MAQVTLQYQIDEEECLTASLSTEANHPDALDELATRAVRILREALVDVYSINRSVDQMDAEGDNEEPV